MQWMQSEVSLKKGLPAGCSVVRIKPCLASPLQLLQIFICFSASSFCSCTGSKEIRIPEHHADARLELSNMSRCKMSLLYINNASRRNRSDSDVASNLSFEELLDDCLCPLVHFFDARGRVDLRMGEEGEKKT